MKKAIRIFLISAASILAALIIFIIVSCVILSPTYISRLFNQFRITGDFESTIQDYLVFPEAVVSKGENTYYYDYAIDESLSDLEISYETEDGRNKVLSLSDFVETTGSTSFIVVKDDVVVYEQYANGYTKDFINTSFSTAKSVVSLLVGIAIDDGYIESEKQSIAVYIDEFKNTEFESITIEDLLLMRSTIEYDGSDGFLWFRDDAYTYHSPDLRDLALNHTRGTDKYDGGFNYNNYHPLLLGIILERSTGMSVSAYLEQEIWQKIGAEYDASWSLDSDKTQFEKMESGINFRSIDFIKIGSMMLHEGNWNGEQIVSKDWIDKSTSHLPINSPNYPDEFGYKYMWWSSPGDAGGYYYFASGHLGQMLYISPATNVVILRTGTGWGDPLDYWAILEYLSSYVS